MGALHYGSWRIIDFATIITNQGQIELEILRFRCTFREFKSYIRYDKYYKPVTFLSFTLNTIKFCPRTIAIPDIFPIFASTFLTDEMNMKIQL